MLFDLSLSIVPSKPLGLSVVNHSGDIDIPVTSHQIRYFPHRYRSSRNRYSPLHQSISFASLVIILITARKCIFTVHGGTRTSDDFNLFYVFDRKIVKTVKSIPLNGSFTRCPFIISLTLFALTSTSYGWNHNPKVCHLQDFKSRYNP